MKHDPYLANDLVVQSLISQIAKLTARVEALEAKRTGTRTRTRTKVVCRSLTEAEAAAAAPIVQSAAARFGTTVLEICGARGSARTISARSFAAYELRRAGMSSVVIGLVLGGRHHTSALYLIERYEKRLGMK